MKIEDIAEEVATKDDIAAFEKGHFGVKTGFGSKPALLIVDMTNEFVDPAFPLVFGEACRNASYSIKELLEVAKTKHLPIIYTRNLEKDIHPFANMLSRKAGTMPSLKHSRANQIVEILSPDPENIVIEKAKSSAFFGTLLQTILNCLGIDTLIITGATTSGCVRATVVDAASYGHHVIVPLECCGDRSQISHKVSLLDMHMKYADVMPVSEVKDYLKHSTLRRDDVD